MEEDTGDFAAVSIATATATATNLNGDGTSNIEVKTEVLEEVKTTDNKQPAGDQEKMDDEEESEEDEDALLDDDEDKMEADMEEKLKIEGDEEEHKDEGHRVGKTWLKIQELKGEVKEKIKEILPPAFKSVRKLTVNIGPIKLVDLKSTGLSNILCLTTHFEMTFDKQKPSEEVDQEKIRRFSNLEYNGYVKMRFEVTTPQFFVLVYNKLTNLNINGRNMSVKLPEQFDETLRDAKEFRIKREAIYKEHRLKTTEMRTNERKNSVYLRNFSEKVDNAQLKSLFSEADEIHGPIKLGGGEARGATLIFLSREEAVKWVQDHQDLEIDDKKIKVQLTVSDKQVGSMEERRKEEESGGKRKKKKKKKGGAGGGEGAGPQQGGPGGRQRFDSGGQGGSGRKRRRGGGGFGGGYNEGYDMPFPYPEGDSNPVAMISMLKSTLARMEDNLTGPRGFMDDGFHGNRGGMGFGGGRMFDDSFGGGGGRFMNQGPGFGNRPSLLGEPPRFGGGMMGGMGGPMGGPMGRMGGPMGMGGGFDGPMGGGMGGFDGGMGDFGGGMGGRNKKRRNKKKN